jgi:hypothetical protein
MNRYEKHLNERLQQKGIWEQLLASLAGLFGMVAWFVVLIGVNLVFWFIVVWIFQKLAGG